MKIPCRNSIYKSVQHTVDPNVDENFYRDSYVSMSSGYPAERTRRASRQMIRRLISNTRGKNSIKLELRPRREKKNIIHLIVYARGIKPVDKTRNENYAPEFQRFSCCPVNFVAENFPLRRAHQFLCMFTVKAPSRDTVAALINEE